MKRLHGKAQRPAWSYTIQRGILSFQRGCKVRTVAEAAPGHQENPRTAGQCRLGTEETGKKMLAAAGKDGSLAGKASIMDSNPSHWISGYPRR